MFADLPSKTGRQKTRLIPKNLSAFPNQEKDSLHHSSNYQPLNNRPMNAHQFAKLTRNQKLEHIVQAKRVTTKHQTYLQDGVLKAGHIAKLNGIFIGSYHPTKEAALAQGRKLLAKFKTEAKELGIPTNQ